MDKSPIKIGDRVVVGTWTEMKVTVEKIVPSYVTGVITIYLDWGEHGKSRVYAHDEGTIWRRFNDVN